MISSPPRSSARLAGIATAFLVAVSALLLVGQPVQATHEIIVLDGTLDADDFLIASDPEEPTRLLLCDDVCFSRARAEVGTIIVNGFDGDDTVTVGHGATMATNVDGALDISINGGPGIDRLAICGPPLREACEASMTTTVAHGASNDERVLTQQATSGPNVGDTVTLTLNDVATIRDESAGAVTVEAGAVADDLTMREVAGDPGTGVVTVNTAAPYRFRNKTSVLLDTGTGADHVTLAEVTGLGGATPGNCAPATAPAAPVCVRGDAGADDTVVAAGATSVADEVRLTPRAAGASSLAGLSTLGPVDLFDIDTVRVTLQSSEDDSLALTTTSFGDVLRTDTTADGVRLTGDLSVDDAPFAMPTVELIGDGSAPLQVSWDAGEGADELSLRTTAADDTVTVDDGCGTSACITTAPDGLAGHQVALSGTERHRVEAGDGDDRLVARADRAADTVWRGGEGADTALVRGTGPDLTMDFAASTIGQDAGTITATATEQLDIDAAGASLATLGTTGDDAFTVRPLTSQSARFELAGHPIAVHATAVAGTNVLATGDGRDRVDVHGNTDDDRFAVARSTDLGVQVDALLPVRVAEAEAAVLTGLDGDDRFDITGAAGPETLTIDGGPDAGADLVTFAAATTDVAVSVDDDLGTGQLDADGPPVGLQGIEKVDVEGDGEDTLTVAGSDAADTITQEHNTVTVGRTTDVAFTGFRTLALVGGPADDQLWVAPATTVGVDDVTATGGAESDTLTVRGTALSETLTYTPQASDGGKVQVGAAPAVSFVAIEAASVDGSTAPPSGDTLVVDTPHHDGTLRFEPGATFDSGTVRFLDLDGVSTTASPLHVGALGRGEIEFAGDPTMPRDRVVLAGQPDDDVVELTARTGSGGEEAVVNLDQQVPVAVPGARTLVLHGGAGTDTFRLPTDHPVPGDAGPGIEVRAGSPDAGDRLELAAGDGALVADVARGLVTEAGHAAVLHTAVEHLDLDANANDLTVVGGDGPDSLEWEPTGPSAGRVTAAGPPTLASRDLGSLTFDPADGADAVTVRTRSVADAVTIMRATTTEVAVTGLQSLLLPASVESLALAAGDGADTVQVLGDGGPSALTVDGGAPSADGDVLRLVAPDAAVSHAPEPSAGRIDSPGGAIVFSTMETIDVVGNGTGSLTIHGTDAAEAITIGDTTTPSVRVDEGADVTYAGYPRVTLDGRGGTDDVTVGLAGMGDVDGLHVDGGPGLDDAVALVDTTGVSRTFMVRPTTAATGSIETTDHRTTLTIAGTESTALDGRGGDDTVTVVTPDGAQQVRVTPGTTADAGSVEVASLVPLAFQQVGAGGHLTVRDAASERVDAMIVAGTSGSDTTLVEGPAGEVRRQGWVTLLPASALDLSLPGGDGDDEVVVSGPLPYRTTTVDGGGPDLGDGLRLQGPAGDVTVDLAAATVTGYGGVITFPGVADLHTDVGGAALTQLGSARDDALCYDPMAPRDGRLYIVGAPGGGTASSTCLPDQRGTNVLHRFVDVARLTVDPAAGEDEVIVNGSTSRDLLTVDAQAPTTEVTVHPQPDSGSSFRLPVHVVTGTTESLVVAADTGADSIDVTTYDTTPTPVITIHGEGPSTRHAADDMVVRDGTGGAHLHNAGSHTKGSGTVTAEYRKGSGAIVRVDYVDVENVTLLRDPKAGD